MDSRYTATVGKEWFEYLSEHCIASSGYGGSLTGMRNKFWGKTAYVIKCCNYLFHVDEDTFYRVSRR